MSEQPPDAKKRKANVCGTSSRSSTSANGDRVTLNVGGTEFCTSRSTLTMCSSYFARLFSEEWISSTAGTGDSSCSAPPAVFLDQDPDSFRILLSYMRLGKVQADALTPHCSAPRRLSGDGYLAPGCPTRGEAGGFHGGGR